MCVLAIDLQSKKKTSDKLFTSFRSCSLHARKKNKRQFRPCCVCVKRTAFVVVVAVVVVVAIATRQPSTLSLLSGECALLEHLIIPWSFSTFDQWKNICNVYFNLLCDIQTNPFSFVSLPSTFSSAQPDTTVKTQLICLASTGCWSPEIHRTHTHTLINTRAFDFGQFTLKQDFWV